MARPTPTPGHKKEIAYLDPEKEASLLQSIVKDPDTYEKICDLIDEQGFGKYGYIFREIADRIERGEDLGAVRVPAAPPASDPVAVARELAELSRRRMLASVFNSALNSLAAGASPRAVLERVQPSLDLLEQMEGEAGAASRLALKSLAFEYTAMAQQRAMIRAATGSPVAGIETGIRTLDLVINGLGEGLYVLGGVPGAGKTSFALQVSAAAAARGTPVVYVAYEDSPVNLAGKVICRRAGIPHAHVIRGWGDPERLREAAEKVGDAIGDRIIFLEGSMRTDVRAVRAVALRAMQSASASRCLVVIDYLQKMGAATSAGEKEDFRLAVTRQSQELRDLARKLKSPVLSIVSLNRAGYKEASLEGIKESGYIEYDADVVLFLMRNEDIPAVRPALAVKLEIKKNRFGETDIAIPLIFRPDIGDFREPEENENA